MNPSTSLRFQQVICDNCTMARDLDFCRDADLAPDGGASESRPWKCGYCGTEFVKIVLEQRMIAEVEAVVTQWATQDLKCGKCGGVRINDFMEHCSCSGVWVGEMKRADIEKKLAIYEKVGKFYELKMLREVLEGVMTGL